jgi:cytochrome P450
MPASPPRPRPVPLVGDLLAFRADRLAFLTRLAEDRGDVAGFRIGPYRVWLLSHPDLVQDALVAHPERFRKGPVLQRARLVLGDGLLTAEGDHHRRHRRLLQPAFHPRRIAGYAEVMVDRAAATTGRWTEGEPLDLHAETVRMTLATAGVTLLGSDVEGDIDLVERAIDDLLSAYRLAFVPFGWRLQHLPVGPPRRLRRGRSALHGLVDRVVAQHRASGRDEGDLLSTLVHRGPGAAGPDRLSDAEVRDEALTLLLAGHETTANALAFSAHLMAGDATVEASVHDEVDQVLDGRLPTAEDVDRLPVCRGLIAEALRLFPPSWAIGREVVRPHPVHDGIVPPGDLVLLSPWVIHRDRRWWPDPERCDPERWMAAGPNRPGSPQDPRPRWAFVPFGAGVRRCIGESFAWTEAILALATIASRWRLHAVPDRPLRLDPLITLRPRDGYWVRPERRPGQPW